jgi:hypothetical protein
LLCESSETQVCNIKDYIIKGMMQFLIGTVDGSNMLKCMALTNGRSFKANNVIDCMINDSIVRVPFVLGMLCVALRLLVV